MGQDEYERILKIDQVRQKQLAEERAALELEREKLNHDRTKVVSTAVAAERSKWEAETSRAAVELGRLRKQGDVERERLSHAHERELQAETRKREVQEKRLVRELAAAQAKAKTEAEACIRETRQAVQKQQAQVIDDLRDQLKTLEQRRRRDEDTLRGTIADLQSKAEVRDKGHFGVEGEENLVRILREQFPGDRVEHHGKGGDVVHVVLDNGREAARIVFEVKKTRAWQAGYVRQTKTAMESRGTRYGILVSHALPARSSGISVVGGVVVVSPAIVANVVAIMRDGIITIARLRLSREGTEAKAAALLGYLRSDDFAVAIRRVQEKMGELRDALSRERSHHDGWWRSREQWYCAILRDVSEIDGRLRELLSDACS